jgi:polyhydroxyalkanoate synthesis repressor PhaR
MIRLIKRYGGGSRKLYDTEESRYVSLEELGAFVREGQELQVVDSASGEDVTSQVLAQSLYEDHKGGRSFLSSDFLHDLIRRSGEAVAQRVEQVQHRVEGFVKTSVESLAPAGAMQEEMALLRQRLAELETSLSDLEQDAKPARPGGSRKAPGTRTKAASARRTPRTS